MFKIQYGFSGNCLLSVRISVNGYCVIHYIGIAQDLIPGSYGSSKSTSLRGGASWDHECQNGISKVLFFQDYEPMIEVRYSYPEDTIRMLYKKSDGSIGELGDTNKEDALSFEEIIESNVRTRFGHERPIENDYLLLYGRSTRYIEASFKINSSLVNLLDISQA